MFHTTFCSVPVLFRDLISVSNTHLEQRLDQSCLGRSYVRFVQQYLQEHEANGVAGPRAHFYRRTTSSLTACLPLHKLARNAACRASSPLPDHILPPTPTRQTPTRRTNKSHIQSQLHPASASTPSARLLQLSLSPSDAGPARRTTFPSTL